jgi:methylglyoxal synthase
MAMIARLENYVAYIGEPMHAMPAEVSLNALIRCAQVDSSFQQGWRDIVRL